MKDFAPPAKIVIFLNCAAIPATVRFYRENLIIHPQISSAPMKEPSISDQELAEKIKQSDDEAFKILYFRYYDKLFRFVWYRSRSQETAQDIVQELFSRVWRSRETLDPEKSIKAYLYRIANNLMINLSNRQTVERAYLSGRSMADMIENPNDRFDVRERIQKAIDQLPNKARTVFALHRFEAFTYAEIAEALGISIKTVEKRMSAALKELRTTLRPFLDSGGEK